MISNCGKDERGKYNGGKSGDQTGKEWHIIPWYNRPWDCVLRHPDKKVRKLISSMAKASAKNDCIGYDQGQRLTFWEQLKKAEYKVNKIKTNCEADCSSGVCSIIKAVGYRLNNKPLKEIDITTTHYMKNMLKKAGFEVLTDKKYLNSDKYLLQGDILLNEEHHTATNITKGQKAKPKEVKKPKNKVTPNSKGKFISWVQIRLLSKGYYNGKIDGVWGKKTKTAVNKFRVDNKWGKADYLKKQGIKALSK